MRAANIHAHESKINSGIINMVLLPYISIYILVYSRYSYICKCNIILVLFDKLGRGLAQAVIIKQENRIVLDVYSISQKSLLTV